MREAAESRVALPEEAYQRARENYLTDLGRLRSTIGLDSAIAAGSTAEERKEFARQAVNTYLARMMRTLRDVVIVPPFLANELRRDGKWEISGTAMDRVINLASQLRSPRGDTTAGGDSNE